MIAGAMRIRKEGVHSDIGEEEKFEVSSIKGKAYSAKSFNKASKSLKLKVKKTYPKDDLEERLAARKAETKSSKSGKEAPP